MKTDFLKKKLIEEYEVVGEVHRLCVVKPVLSVRGMSLVQWGYLAMWIWWIL
jgi:hypothetical protein